MTSCDIVVVGGGPAGLAAACLFANEQMQVTLVAPDTMPDPRTAALMQPSLRLLDYIGIWPGDLQKSAAPLRRQRIVDDTGSLATAPDLTFRPEELGFDAFAWNIPLTHLCASLQARASSLGVKIVSQLALSSTTTTSEIIVHLQGGESVAAQYCIAADGGRSVMRANAGITTNEWHFDQSALVATFAHGAPHDDTSIEFHKPGGPCTVVPLPGRRSALVWMNEPAKIEKLEQCPEPEFLAELQAAIHGTLGLISDLSPRRVFPMRGLTATRFAAGRTLLAGEAAHVVPPIGAQGLNMSFRDIATAADIIVAGRDSTPAKVVSDYDMRRRRDVVPRQTMVSATNSSLLLQIPPLEAARAASLWTIKTFAPLRDIVMRTGLGLVEPLPFAMRERPVLGELPAKAAPQA